MLKWLFKAEKESYFEFPDLSEITNAISCMTIKFIAPITIERARKICDDTNIDFDGSICIAFVEDAILYYFTADTIGNKKATLKNISKWLDAMTDIRFAIDMNKNPALNEFIRCLYTKYSEFCNFLNSIDSRVHVNRFDEQDFTVLMTRVMLNMKNYPAIKSAI